jgi:Restriction endonuclease
MTKALKKSPLWRDREKIAARIEGLLAPMGAVIKSPDWLADINTGQKRQVDVSIRYKIGTATILIFVECRLRGKKDDQTWIEQLPTKRENLGADKVIIVSSKRLTEPALELARRKSIEVRLLSELSNDIVKTWLQSVAIRVSRLAWQPLTIELDCRNPNLTEEELQCALARAHSSFGWNAKMFQVKSSGICSAHECFQDFETLGLLKTCELPPEKDVAHFGMELAFPMGFLTMIHEQDCLMVRKMRMTFNLVAVPQPVEHVERFSEYKDAKKTLLQTAEYSTVIGDCEITASIQRNMENGAITYGISELNRQSGLLSVFPRSAEPSSQKLDE